jgi:nucleoside-diphosphate-sugar epimerase
MLVATGAAGFIGLHLVAQLALMGYEVWLVDHPLTPAKAANEGRVYALSLTG